MITIGKVINRLVKYLTLAEPNITIDPRKEFHFFIFSSQHAELAVEVDVHSRQLQAASLLFIASKHEEEFTDFSDPETLLQNWELALETGMVNIELDIDDDAFLQIAKAAHALDITFNEFLAQTIRGALDKRV